MKNFPSDDEDYNLWVLVDQTRRTSSKARQRELKPYNLSTRQAAVLFLTDAIAGTATPSKMSRWLLLAPHSVSELLSRMERGGLVRKIKQPGKKEVQVVLTEAGRKAYYQSIKRDSIRNIMSTLSGEERRQLRSCLQKLLNGALKELGMCRRPPFP